jgi:hypothetical protein
MEQCTFRKSIRDVRRISVLFYHITEEYFKVLFFKEEYYV